MYFVGYFYIVDSSLQMVHDTNGGKKPVVKNDFVLLTLKHHKKLNQIFSCNRIVFLIKKFSSF